MIAGWTAPQPSHALDEGAIGGALSQYSAQYSAQYPRGRYDCHRAGQAAVAAGPTAKLGTASGVGCALLGWIDNETELQASLRAPDLTGPGLFAAAIAKWGREADRHINGNYAAIAALPDGSLRLSRAPWDAPPVYHARKAGMAIASPLMRALFAGGIARNYDFDRMVDELALNWRDTEEAAWHHGVLKVPLGSVVELTADRHEVYRWYAPPDQMAAGDYNEAEAVATARALLDTAAEKALRWAKKPMLALSGGLDSPLVATSLLKAMPSDGRLHAATFVPDDGWDGREPPGLMGDESGLVQTLVARNPRIAWTKIGGDIGGFDLRAREMFAAMEVFAPGLANVGMYHGLYGAAREQGCDALLTADMANATFSDGGRYTYCEYARPGTIGQLIALLRNRPGDTRSLPRKLLALSVLPHLPPFLRNALRRIVHPARQDMTAMMTALSPNALSAQRLRAQQRGEHPFWDDQVNDRSRAEAIEREWREADGPGFDVDLGFEQLYGVRRRDVTAYRPLLEFCMTLPARAFAWDGEERRLARLMGKGRVPDEIRTNTRHGQHNIDWHARITPRRAAMLDDFETMRAHPWLNDVIDIDRMETMLRDWPDAPTFDMEQDWPRMLALPRALLAARFIGHLEGRNDL